MTQCFHIRLAKDTTFPVTLSAAKGLACGLRTQALRCAQGDKI
jgi:hypothetical protein